ncbi:MAG TPA: phosphonate ABC transporter ATP-binding protein [Desulfobulbaceae bacterium]|nr:phosphonate ABC transporter ATP-binding protein [Desulfobulbaceae bacterium]
MIRAAELRKTFSLGNIETHAIQNITLHIREGEFAAVMGPSGCGKSTLLHLLGLLDTPTGGSLSLMGKEVGRYSENQRGALRKGNIGFVFQSFNLIDELNVYENVELPLIYLKIPAQERKKRVNDLLEKLKIAHRRAHFPQHLSGGQQQRTAFARAVIAKPQLILADEPTGNLDSSNGHEVMQLLANLHREGTTIVMVTHSPQCAEQADRTIRLFDGQVVG